MFLQSLTLKNVLSFKNTTIELGPLNVLIGANASGKSNLIEVISLLQAAPTDLRSAILRGGGVHTWIWLGDPAASPIASVECTIEYKENAPAVRYSLEFSEDAQGFVILDEWLKDAKRRRPNGYFKRTGGQVVVGGHSPSRKESQKNTGPIPVQASVLERWKSPVDPTPTSQLGRALERVRIFREFRTSGVYAHSRSGIPTAERKDFLEEGGDNLALVLLELDFHGLHDRVRTYLKRFCDRFEDVKVRITGTRAQTYLLEAGLLEPLPGLRLSDGTLKFLCLLAVLFHPDPPPLLCIEEPELGLHPDALQIVVDLLVEASERTQLIVTTHSEAMIDALSSRPESVLVCDRDLSNSTQFRRLSKKQLAVWLERYTLGELWRKGEVGGNPQ